MEFNANSKNIPTVVMLKYNVDSLSNLATDVFCVYVSSLCAKMLTLTSQDMSKLECTREMREEEVKEVSDRLHQMIVEIPSQAANYVTTKLLAYVSERLKKYNGNFATSDVEWIMSNILNAVIHPAVTNLSFERYHGTLHSYACRDLGTLKSLKVLKLQDISGDPLYSFPFSSLQELTIDHIPYAFLQKLSTISSNIQKIHIKWFSVNHAAVKCLLRFQRLVDLNILFCRISAENLTVLLQGLSENRGTSGVPMLKNFECDFIAEDHFTFLARNFHLQGIGTVNSAKIKFPECFNHLKSLSIKRSKPNDEALLSAVGHQLSHLEIKSNVNRRTLKAINDHCPSLTSIRLASLDDISYEDSQVTLPSFKSLGFVDLHFAGCPNLLVCILSNCTDVRALKVHMERDKYEFDEFDEEEVNIADALEKNPLAHVEELNWWSSSTSDMGIQVVKHCQIQHDCFWESQFKCSELYNVDTRHVYAIRL